MKVDDKIKALKDKKVEQIKRSQQEFHKLAGEKLVNPKRGNAKKHLSFGTAEYNKPRLL